MRPRSMATKGSSHRSRSNRRRSKRARRPSREAEPTPSGPTGVHHIPDHLLELVLLRVGTPLALLRAASTCKRWRRLIFTDDAPFPDHRFRRSLRAARVAGHYHVDGNNHIFVPDPSAADGLDRRHFSLDFLPAVPHGSLPWELADSRGGLLLFYRRDVVYYRMGHVWEGDPEYLHFPDMVVCDPLNRRYQGILYWEEMWPYQCLGLFLLDAAAADEPAAGGSSIGMSNFRVVAVVYESDVFEDDRGAPRACVFSSGGDGGWRQESTAGDDVPIPEYRSISFAGRARSSFFWRMEHEGAVLALDDATIQFSLVTFPSTVVGTPEESSAFWAIGGGDGAARIVRVMANNDLTVFQQLQSSGEWVVEKLVRLPEATSGLSGREETYFQQPAKIVATTTRHVLVTPQEETWIFSVDLETLEVDRAHERNRYAGAAYPFELPWAPALRVDHRRHRGRMDLTI
ncbi:hypothetical protein CFC21_013813 [Triticum aestivum]|uniref:F-box domain-containing protein n=5 Tax=Triticinae TaxID=1648030 RepID=A0A3B6A1I4_WHEAT|nr:uncharacterized protein LOC109784122 [Aegilops tauschii subsp. strangulata]XP_044446787.1 uncharacterized protein LOC123176798 [Triticum aestivum]KAF6997606.1 hypothetical protein CFC21_013813 [Triticum aestivum]